MFSSILRFQGTPAILYDAYEANPQPVSFFSSRSRSLRMLGTERANVEMMWVDGASGVAPGMIVQDTARAVYYLAVMAENDATVVPGVPALTAINVLRFSPLLKGNSYAPAAGAVPSVYGDYTTGLVATPKTVRPIFEVSTEILSVDMVGPLPDGQVRFLCSYGSGVAMDDEYSWSGLLWRVTQINPAWAAGAQFGVDAIMKQTTPQTRQVT